MDARYRLCIMRSGAGNNQGGIVVGIFHLTPRVAGGQTCVLASGPVGGRADLVFHSQKQTASYNNNKN